MFTTYVYLLQKASLKFPTSLSSNTDSYKAQMVPMQKFANEGFQGPCWRLVTGNHTEGEIRTLFPFRKFKPSTSIHP